MPSARVQVSGENGRLSRQPTSHISAQGGVDSLRTRACDRFSMIQWLNESIIQCSCALAVFLQLLTDFPTPFIAISPFGI